jgi:hypothetical protein
MGLLLILNELPEQGKGIMEAEGALVFDELCKNKPQKAFINHRLTFLRYMLGIEGSFSGDELAGVIGAWEMLHAPTYTNVDLIPEKSFLMFRTCGVEHGRVSVRGDAAYIYYNPNQRIG